MVQRTPQTLARLFELDETAWLERTAEILRAGRFDQLDPATLAEYLTDMAKRDRREVFSRLVVLLAHLLKGDRQPDRCGGSWRGTIREQRRELRQLLESGTLRNHAEAVLADAYAEAREQAADETELDIGAFPAENPWTLERILRGLDAEPISSPTDSSDDDAPTTDSGPV
jgi:hypothetical protein